MPETVVHLSPSSALHIRSWDDECVVFDVASSTTHLIQQPAGLLLEWVMDNPATLAHLADRLKPMVSIEDQAGSLQFVLNAAQSFVAMGLLEVQELSV